MSSNKVSVYKNCVVFYGNSISLVSALLTKTTPILLNKTIMVKSTKLIYDIGLGFKQLLKRFGIFCKYIILKVYILTSTHFIIGLVLRSY